MTEFSHILGTLEPWIREYGSAAVFLISTPEFFGLPLPGESLAHRGCDTGGPR